MNKYLVSGLLLLSVVYIVCALPGPGGLGNEYFLSQLAKENSLSDSEIKHYLQEHKSHGQREGKGISDFFAAILGNHFNEQGQGK